MGSLKTFIQHSILVPTLACGLTNVLGATEAEVVLNRLQSYEPGTRESAALVAGREGITEAIPLLVVGLRDKNARGIKTAGEALAWMGPAAAPTIVELLADSDPYVRAEVLYGLQFFDGTAAERAQFVPAVQPLLRDSNRYVRRNALKYLATVGADAEPVIADLKWLLDDAVNRNYAAGVLGLIGQPAWPVIHEALLADDVAVQLAALLAVERLTDPTPAVIADLQPMLQQSAVARPALFALAAVASVDPTASVAAIEALLPTIAQDTNSTTAAAQVLLALPRAYEWDQHPDLAAALMAAAVDKDKRVRVSVAQALARMQATDACQQLMKAYAEGAGVADRHGDIPFMRSVLPLVTDPTVQQGVLARVATPGKDHRGRAKRLNAGVVALALEHIEAPADLLASLRQQKDIGVQAAAAAAQVRQGIDADAITFLNGLTQTPGTGRKEQGIRQAAWRQMPATPQWQPAWAELFAASPEVRQAALLAVPGAVTPDGLSANQAIALLQPLTSGSAVSDRLAAAEALLAIEGADHAAAEALLLANINQLRDWRARAAIIGRLGSILSPNSAAGLAALKVWAKDPDYFTRDAATAAIAQLQQAG